MKKIIITFLILGSYNSIAQVSKYELDPQGSAGGDLFGLKVTETGNNTTKFHIYRNFTYESNDINFLTIDLYGKVGIGTINPTAGLHIQNEDGLKIDDSSPGFPGVIKMSDGFSNTATKDDILFQSDGAFLFKLDHNGNGISNFPGFGIFDKDNNSIFFAKNNGNIGIGKLTPTAKLHVDGNIIAEEIKVEDVTGADFVFEPNYNLMPLAEIEAFVKQNHHLPEVPSAAEMQTNGVELGKMNMLLLQKIEELTLLMIEQQKQLENQNSKIDAQNTVIATFINNQEK